MTLDVYHGRKTTTQHNNDNDTENSNGVSSEVSAFERTVASLALTINIYIYFRFQLTKRVQKKPTSVKPSLKC